MYLFYFLSVSDLAPFLLAGTETRKNAIKHFRMRLHCLVKPFCMSLPTIRDDCNYGDPVHSFLRLLNTHNCVISGVRAMHAMSSAFMGGAPMELQIHIPATNMRVWSKFLCAPGCYKEKLHFKDENSKELLMWCNLAQSVCVFEGIDMNIGKLLISRSVRVHL